MTNEQMAALLARHLHAVPDTSTPGEPSAPLSGNELLRRALGIRLEQADHRDGTDDAA